MRAVIVLTVLTLNLKIISKNLVIKQQFLDRKKPVVELKSHKTNKQLTLLFF
jgi:hypothetical protein